MMHTSPQLRLAGPDVSLPIYRRAIKPLIDFSSLSPDSTDLGCQPEAPKTNVSSWVPRLREFVLLPQPGLEGGGAAEEGPCPQF